MAQDIVIVAAARTPVGSFNGALASQTAAQLGTIALKAAMERAKVDAGEINEIILGQVLTAAQGQNPARQAAIHAGIPNSATAWGINQVCGSGLRAVAIAAQQIADGSAQYRGGRRARIDEQVGPRRPPAGRRQDG